MTIFVCEDTFEGVLTGVYDAWASRIHRKELTIMVEPVTQMELFANYVYVKADTEKAGKVMSSIHRKISYYAYRQCMNCAISPFQDRSDVIYRFLLLGFTVGPEVTKHLKEPAVMRLFEYSRRVGNESHYYREFLRFHRLKKGIYISFITPKSDVLPFVGEHFSDRMPSEQFMIIDDKRKIALIHPKDQNFFLRNLTDQEYESLKEYENQEDEISDLWKVFFENIAIKERTNPKCQLNHLPLYYRKHMTEFR